ncbi:MAG: Ig-like domain-containing protein [Clostridia bacterium]|nr:Ig-like domain-containing protein [Clostridia bacterium]
MSYTHSFNANSGSITPNTSITKKYYNTIGSGIPTSGTRAGYEYLAMYGSAKTEYSTTKPTVGTTSGYTGQLTTSTRVEGDKTWYAAWWAKNINVKYLNNDGSVVKPNGTGKVDKKADFLSSSSAPADPTYVPATGVNSGGTFTYRFDHWEVADAKQYNTAGAQVEYPDIVGKDYNTAVLKGDTTFKAVYVIDDYIDYHITYKNASETTTGTFHYKDNGYKDVTLPAADAENNKYTYEFLGWAVQLDPNDTVYWQNWDDATGAYVAEDPAQEPMNAYASPRVIKVYRDRTWVAVYGRRYIDYQVTFNFVGVSTDPDTGAKVYSAANQVVYTKHYDQSFELPEALSYTGGKLSGTAPAGASYSNTTGYIYNFSAWNPALSGNPGASIAISALSGFANSNANLKTKTFNATYSPVAAVYTITFVAPDTMTGEDGKEYAQYEGGELKTIVLNPDDTQFSHGSSVASTEAYANPNKSNANDDIAKAVKVYRDDQYEYTFTGWTPAFASSATDDVTYTATYTQEQIFTVRYADENGELTSWRGTASENIPVLPNGLATPTKDDDSYATNYVFSGWDTTEYDAAHPVTPAIAADGTRNMTVPEGGTIVYAQFTREPIIYTINFIYGTPAAGSDVMPSHEQNLEYGQTVAIPSGDTVARADDDTYHYTFRGWDTTPSETVDGNATYTALYRKSYVYYDAIWYQPDLTATPQTMTVGDENWVYYAPTTETVREETYIYNALISAPYQSPNKPASSDPNQDYVLAGWLYKDTLGNTTPTLLTRADRMGVVGHLVESPKTDRAGQIELVPVFVLKANIKTVKFYDDDGTTLLGEQDVAYGTAIADIAIGTPSKASTEATHSEFAAWVMKEDGTAAPTTVTEDIELKATYTTAAHTWALAESDIVKMPTFLEKGQGEAECPTCHRRELVQIDELVDNRVPEGRVTVKNGAWEEIADDETEVAAGAQNLFMVNTIDKTFTGENPNAAATKTVYKLDDEGELTENTISVALPAFDTENAGSGTKEIYICTKTATADPTAIAEDDWYQVFNYAEYIVLNPNATEANFSALLGDIVENSGVQIADGETFWVYVKMVDNCDNTSYISTAPLVYDKTAPEITITSTDGRTGIKHCVDATIAVSSPDWFNITKNGTEAVDLPFDRTLREAGEYTIIAEDEAGNTTTQVVQIIGSHSPKTVVIPATCTVDGQRYDVCRFCGQTISEVETTAAPGHDLKIKIKQPTCVNNGTVTITCRNCSDVNEVYHETEDLIEHEYAGLVATGEHTFDEGVVVKAATCSATGLKRFSCTVCDYYEDRELPINENAHLWSRPITIAATCTEEGMVYRECRYNSTHEKNVIEILPPTGHIASDEWVETLAPTCTTGGTEVQYCLYHPDVIVNTRDTDPLGHELVVDHVVEPTATEQGYTVYKCTRCDYTENGNYVDPLARYTVTFIVGDNSEPIERALGETITSAMLTISTDKASDDEYKYTFDCWKKAEKNADDEWVATDTTVKMPITVSEDMAVIATYKSSLINYRIDFLYDNGESYKIKGYEHWNNVVTVEDPTKDPTATETYTFAGWKKAEKNSDDVWVATGDFVEEIVCKGDATYIAVFDATPITYTVIWADRAEGTYTALKTLTVAGGTDVTSENPALTGITLKTPNQNGHWVATGWDKQEEAANVTSDLVIRPIQEQVAHSYTTTTAAVSCTEPAKTIYTCACGYSYETTTGRPLGHNYSIEVSRVNPTADADGYKIMKCSRCGDQTNVTLPRIFLKITVKDNNHNAVSGVTVKVYDGDTYIGSGVSDSNGVATILVPEAKTYRIVIEGKEGSVTVNENGKITNSSIPTVDRDNGGNGGGNSGCDCTCHKSGFWPMIFRFFHKIIKLLTGEFRCCPDANY